MMKNDILEYQEKLKNKIVQILEIVESATEENRFNNVQQNENETEENIAYLEKILNSVKIAMEKEIGQNINSDLAKDKLFVTEDNTEKIVTSPEKGNKTLLISEKKGKVYLPHTQSDIEQYLNEKVYNSEEEVIEKQFIVPLSRYSNFAVSRVVEGFKLMREKEKAGFGEALKYAFNLMNERRLHPAVITACKKVDDLDIYLACLEDDVLSLFDVFEVVFEYAPIKTLGKGKNNIFEVI